MTEETSPAPVYHLRSSLLAVILAFIITLSCLPAHYSLMWLQRADLADDAYISARYAKNLINGYGLVYNHGINAGPRVEGYSNFLWTMAIAAGLKRGLKTYQITQGLGLSLNMLALIIALFYTWMKVRTNRWAMPAVGLTLALSLPYAIWAVEGMETPLFALLVLLAFVTYGDGGGVRLTAVLAAVLAGLTRPDGVLVVAALLIARLAILIKRRQWPTRSDIFNAVLFAVPYYSYFLWRYYYYNSFFPNTFYARVGLGPAAVKEGLRYLWDFGRGQGIGFMLLLVLGLAGMIKSRKDIFAAPLIFFILSVGFILWVGGDFMPDGRFVMHFFPLLTVMLWIGFTDAEDALIALTKGKLPHHGLTAVVLVGLVALSASRIYVYETRPSFEKEWHRHQAAWYMPAASWALHHIWQGETLAVGDIGYIGYISDLDNILDTHGLVNRYLARLPGIATLNTDLDYILDQKPAWIISLVHEYPGGVLLGHTEFDRQLAKSEKFKQQYQLNETLPGWDSVEVSRTDMVRRQSRVFFYIYYRRPAAE